MELLAPAGDFNKLKTAIHFGADAVYVGGNRYGLRQKAKNFDDSELAKAVEYCHERDKKIYVTCNIVAHNEDFEGIEDYMKFLDEIGVDALIISDLGIFAAAKKTIKRAELHVSTQANVTNKYSAMQWVELGADRIVLARELSLAEISEIRSYLPDRIQLEAFVHGAMCISHSGRCLLSNFLSKRDGNRGACVQACRWEYTLHESSRPDKPLGICEDERGSYILNSKDLNMLEYMDKLIESGVDSFKIEGRMKSQYYVASVAGAYRRAIDSYLEGNFSIDDALKDELKYIKHRHYTTGFYFGEYDSVSYDDSQSDGECEFTAEVIGYDESTGAVVIEQRNRFYADDELEILSSDKNITGKKFRIDKMTDLDGNAVYDAKLVQQKLLVYTCVKPNAMDIIRKKIVKEPLNDKE